MKFTIIHLWILACVAYGVAILMAFEGSLVGSVLFGVIPVAIELHNVGDDPWGNRSSVLLMGG